MRSGVFCGTFATTTCVCNTMKKELKIRLRRPSSLSFFHSLYLGFINFRNTKRPPYFTQSSSSTLLQLRITVRRRSEKKREDSATIRRRRRRRRIYNKNCFLKRER